MSRRLDKENAAWSPGVRVSVTPAGTLVLARNALAAALESVSAGRMTLAHMQAARGAELLGQLAEQSQLDIEAARKRVAHNENDDAEAAFFENRRRR